ncbi:MAG: hypothetical protein KatS3mg039_0394 [Candidatus Kapaibacterium sp.]|nr:MAG: hypothetical protein KatS3mg039_0394 [Candidatus Kapabacteria bacterium]
MNRRDFLWRLVSNPPTTPLGITTGLDPYKPDQLLSQDDALHLLRRATLGVSRQDLARAQQMTTRQAVQALFSGNQTPNPPPWATIDPTTENFPSPDARQQEYYRRYAELQQWWLRRMITEGGFSILEKLVFFWHNHYCSDYLKVYYPQYMYLQNQTFRQMAWGNVRELARAMVADPAMLIYLDNVASIKGNPNENFARELLELFTLGVGHYTEHDIVEAARALTGWRIQGMRGVFNQQLWDPGVKDFLGRRGTFNADDIIAIIFEQDQAARFIATKIYRTFVYDVPNPDIVEQLAQLLKANNYELRPMLETLLMSEHFFDPAFRGALIKSPIEFMVGLCRQLSFAELPLDYGIERMARLTLELLNPPTVEGWKGHHLWINTNTYPLRERIAEYFADGKRNDNYQNFPTPPDVRQFAASFSSNAVAREFVSDVARFLLAIPPGPNAEAYLLDELLLGAPEYEWSLSMPNVELRLRSLLKAIFTLPEYQLL